MLKELQLLRRCEAEARQLLKITAAPDLPEAIRQTAPSGYVDTRLAAYAISRLIPALSHPGSALHGDGALRALIGTGLAYIERERRESGCFDLSSCNFDSAPDTAFPVTDLMDALETLPAGDPLCPQLKDVIERACEGISAGGFHTPNHRWVIAACLKQAARLTGREDFDRRADAYLGEGLDINSEGEFAERSTGIYNVVNDEKMLRLYLLTGDEQYLRAARANLEMMRRYIDPDGSLFTPNSTRQDKGTKVWASRYWPLYLLTGYLMKDAAFAGLSRELWDIGVRSGQLPAGLAWLMRYPELEAFGEAAEAEAALTDFSQFYRLSGVARFRRGQMSVTALKNHADFLYIASGGANLCVSLYGNVCDRRNFIPDALEETPEGCRLTMAMPSWYYLPFEGGGPATRDWWEMNNPETRRRQIKATLRYTVDVRVGGDGVDLRLRAEGLDRVPLRLELGFTPGLIRGETFTMDAGAGRSMYLSGGAFRLIDPSGSGFAVSPCFGRHTSRERMGGAFPESPGRFTVYCTDFTPADRTIHIGTF